jgi:hypothetical protein
MGRRWWKGGSKKLPGLLETMTLTGAEEAVIANFLKAFR